MKRIRGINAKGQMSWQMILFIMSIIGLVIASIIIFWGKGTGMGFISRLYDWVRYGGSFT